MNILVLCHSYPNYAPDLLLHGLRKLFGNTVVDYPRKDCLYEGICGQPYLGTIKNLMADDADVDRTDIGAKMASGFFDFVICDIRALSEHRQWLQQNTCRLAILDGEDKPTHISPGITPCPFAILRRETDGCDFSIPLLFSLPIEVIDWIDSFADVPKTHSIGFLGSRSTPQRSIFLDELTRIFPDSLFECKGFDQLRGRGDYYRNLQSCKVVLNLPGAGYDTFRYWENAACNSLHIAEWMPLFIPDDFREGREIIRFRTLDELTRSVEPILSGRTDWREYAERSREQLLMHHTTERRARYAIDRLKVAFDFDRSKTLLSRIPRGDPANRLLVRSPARHAEPSMLLSLDDANCGPSARLLDLGAQLAAEARHTTHPLLSARRGSGRRWFEVFPGEHYHLLTALARLLQPHVVWEFGTDSGMGTVALLEGVAAKSQIYTVDVDSWTAKKGPWLTQDDFASGRLKQIISDMKAPELFAQYAEALAEADLIFVGGPKDGFTGAALLERLSAIPFRRAPIVMLDDIRMTNMQTVWRNLERPKFDFISYGHWTGSGLVDWQAS